MRYTFDETGSVIGFSTHYPNFTNGYWEDYLFAKNLQGDVVAMYLITVEPPRLIATYEYDEWGKVKTVRDATGAILTDPAHLANRNPFRYRGYHYDIETGFYYLQSRYYDPAISRFINADSYGSTGQAFLGTNMFAYCGNNPVNQVDLDGTVSIWFYLLFIDHDMGMVHRLVQETIKSKYGIDKERWVGMNIGKYFGRVDLLNGKTGEVWEIKHGKVKGSPAAIARIAEAQMQALKYIGSQTKEGTPVVKLGAAGAFSGDITIPLYDYVYTIEYETPAPGCVLYYITKSERQKSKEEVMATAAAAAATATYTATVIAGAPAVIGSAGLGMGAGVCMPNYCLTGREGRWILEPF